MISIIGFGSCGNNIASLFEGQKKYKTFYFSRNIEEDKKHIKLPYHSAMKREECEKNIPNIKHLDIDNNVQVFLSGTSFSSNYVLGILEQIKDRDIEIYYIKPDIDLLFGLDRLQERVMFGVLQEYARSGLFKSITIISNKNLENILGNVPVKRYYETLNNTIYYLVSYINYLNNTKPLLGNLKEPSEVQRIRTFGMVNVNSLEEKMLFNLDTERDVCYYLLYNKDKLENDGELHRKLLDKLKNKPRNAFKNITYSIFESGSDENIGFCVAHTNVVQINP